MRSPESGIKSSRHTNIFVLLVTVTVSVVFSEIVLHWIIPPDSPPKAFIHRLSENPTLLYEPVPGAASEAYGVQNRINDSGFRGRQVSLEKSPGTLRMIFLGDSVVYGYGLGEEQTIPEKLRFAYLARNQAVEILNMGVSGYDSEQQIEFFKTKGLPFNPDRVIVGYTLNDSRYASWELDIFRGNQLSVAKEKNLSVPRKLLVYLYTHSRLIQAINKLSIQLNYPLQKKIKELQGYPLLADYLEKKYKLAQDAPSSDYAGLEAKIETRARELGTSPESLDFLMKGIGFRNENPLYSSHWNKSWAAFKELSALGKAKNFKISVVIFPIVQEMEKYPLEPLHDFLFKQFSSLDFQVIDITDLCTHLTREVGRPAVTGDAVHFTPFASSKIGEFVYEQLEGQSDPS